MGNLYEACGIQGQGNSGKELWNQQGDLRRAIYYSTIKQNKY